MKLVKFDKEERYIKAFTKLPKLLYSKEDDEEDTSWGAPLERLLQSG